MNLKPCLQSQLKTARDFSEELLSAFKKPEEWTHQVHPQANHPLWFAGHMAVSDNFFVSILAPERVKHVPGFAEKFGPGSQPTNNPSDYPDPEEVLAYMRDRRATLIQLLDALDEDDLSKPTPPGTPEFLRDWGAVFQTAVWHEGVHSGQVTVARRALGHKPLMM